MELRHFRYFVAIAEERSFTRAAERLWVAQPGLSTQIRRLETELGVRLFERHTRGVDLTPAGALFLERARVALAAVEEAGAIGRDLERGTVGAIRLGLATTARWRGTSSLLGRFARERAGVELTVLEGYGGTMWRDLRDGHLDAMIAPAACASGDLQRLELGAEPWVVLVGRDHRLAGIGPVEAGELEGEQIAVTGHRDGACYDRAIAEMLAEAAVPATLVAAGPEQARYRMLQEGTVVVLTTAPDALPQGVVARRLEPARGLAFTLLWRDDAPSPALREFVRIAAELAGRPPNSRPALALAA
jgi:DNA-binding transcriptional LysR family regulator